MRILMLGWEFPPHISGGLGTACHGMTQALAKRGQQVVFILPRVREGAHVSFLEMISASGTPISPDMDRRIAWSQAHVWEDRLRTQAIDAWLVPYVTPETYHEALMRMGESTDWLTELPGGGYTYRLYGGYGPSLLDEVRRFAQLAAAAAMQETFDVIHVHDWMTYPAGILIKQLTGKPLVAHIHATEFDRSGLNVNHLVYGIERAGMWMADRVVAVSELTRRTVIEHYGIDPEKVQVVHNAVARHEVVHRYKVPERIRHEKRVLFLGRITFQKGPEYFMEAARLVLDRVPNVRFFMAGSGDMLPLLIRRAGELRIGSRFHFAGFLRGEDVDRIYALSDLYVMPSVSEPFGITPLEAMLYDVPVLLSRQSGVSEILTHALKADFWDTRDMADKICAVLTYPCLSRELVRNCHEEMRNIRWENSADQLIAIYSSLAGR
ncbi:MAG: glycosyltransferase family 4 protein [Desulfovibrio sp.]|jgi:glycosyltransferase involved in cell wall biosynthesis|nr:glycosyltransferase family 4 protein [Desulfovibrio sp.]